MTDAQDRGEERKKMGRLAEKEFSAWCTRADLTVNKAEEDDEGWDFFVQARASNSPRRFLDHEAPALNGMVQVKATGDADGVVRMSLSNALKLAKYAGPAFVFIAHVDGDDVTATWLLHCGENFISRALEAAVRADHGLSLNRRTLSFRPALDDCVSRATFRAKLEELTGDTTTYSARKTRLLESVGYGEARYVIRLNVPTDDGLDPERQFAEFLVGAREIDGVTLQVEDRRFDVSRPLERIENALVARKTADCGVPAATLLFEGSDGRRAEIDCTAYVASSYAPALPASAEVVRLVAPYFEFISREEAADRIRFDVSFPDLDTPIPGNQLLHRANVARVARFFQEGYVRVRARVGGSESELLYDGSVRADPNPLPAAIDDLATLVQQFSIPLGSRTIVPELLAQAARGLRGIAELVRGVGGPSKARFSLENDMPFRPGERMTVVSPVFYRFPTALLAMVVAIAGVPRQEAGMCIVEGRRARLLIGRALYAPTRNDVDTLFESACRILDEEGGATLLPLLPSRQVEEAIAAFERGAAEE